jgi:hypothetical protein
MKRGWKIAGIAVLVAILGVATVGSVVLAQDAQDQPPTPFDFAAKFREAIASALGITVDQFDAAVQKAQNQVVDEAVTEGWLTDQQAEALKGRLAEQPEGQMWGFGKGLGGFGRFGFRFGFGRGMGGFLGGLGEDNLLSIAADKLGMPLADLRTELQSGKTIADVAGEKGVDTQVIVDAAVAQLQTSLAQAVTNGSMTQTQADYALAQAKTRITNELNSAWHGFGGRMRGGWGGGTKEAPATPESGGL